MASVNSLLARLEKLEQSSGVQVAPYRIVLVLSGETEAEAMQREIRECGEMQPRERLIRVLFVAPKPPAAEPVALPDNVIALR